jgi:hypothetical protein
MALSINIMPMWQHTQDTHIDGAVYQHHAHVANAHLLQHAQLTAWKQAYAHAMNMHKDIWNGLI